MRSLLKKALMMAGIAWLTMSPAAQSANVLFVSDADDDTSIVTALEGDGHTVTAVYNDYDDTTMDNTVLQGDLSPLSPHDPLIDSAAERHGDRTGLAFRKSRFWQTNMEKI
jgi:opacity protein-like surface antigen